MAWVKLDDAMPHHPKVMAAGPQAFALDVAGICYSNKHATDGFIADFVLPAVLPSLSQPQKWARKLVQVGRWHEVAGGWEIHDVADYQPTAAEQKEISRKRAEAGRRGGSKSKPPARSRPETNGKQVASGGLEANQNPDPTRPQPEENNTSDVPSDTPFSDTVHELTRRLAKAVKANGHKVPSETQTKRVHAWLDAIDKLLRLDGADPDEVTAVIDFATSDEFWRANIQSAGKFREKFSQLRLQSQRSNVHPFERPKSFLPGGEEIAF